MAFMSAATVMYSLLRFRLGACYKRLFISYIKTQNWVNVSKALCIFVKKDKKIDFQRSRHIKQILKKLKPLFFMAFLKTRAMSSLLVCLSSF